MRNLQAGESSCILCLLLLYKARTHAFRYFLHPCFFQQVKTTLLNTYYCEPAHHRCTGQKRHWPCSKKTGRTPGEPAKRPGKANFAAGEQEDPDLCYCGRDEYNFETTLTATDYNTRFSAVEQEIMKEEIYPRKAMNVLFSGEQGWLKPDE